MFLASEVSNKMLFELYHTCCIPGRGVGTMVFKFIKFVGFGVIEFEICLYFLCLPVMIPLLHHGLSIRNLMSLCTGIPRDPSVMIMTRKMPNLLVSFLIMFNKFKSTSLCPLFQNIKHTMKANQRFWADVV